jgi:hypothetical protein
MREYSLFWSILMPGGILFLSTFLTYLLYRHFSRKS